MALDYTHIQSVPSSTWTVTHNLGHTPVGDVFVTVGGVVQSILPLSVIHTSDNQLQITFSEAIAGSVRLL